MEIDRRAFLGSSAAAGLVAYSSDLSVARASDDTGMIGRSIDAIPTPGLLLDIDAFEENIAKMAAHCRNSNRQFRPHAKTHKCPEIARRQVESGAVGVCVATVPEAEAMVDAGIRGVLLTSPIMERDKIDRMVKLAKAGEVMLSVGDRRQVELVAEAAEASRTRVELLIDLDVGDGRTGAMPGKPALELGQLINRIPSVRLRGVQAYSGRASHTKGFDRRAAVSREAMAQAVETRRMLEHSGLECSILSGGSTGTHNIDSGIDGVTELQVGSYVFMDVDYRGIGKAEGNPIFDDFRTSLTVLSTVVSAGRSDRVSVDAGVKAFAPSPDPVVKGMEGLTYRRSGDEFGALNAAAGAELPRLGDRVELIVPHCDPTVALYEQVYVVRDKVIQEVWPIVARREYLSRRKIN